MSLKMSLILETAVFVQLLYYPLPTTLYKWLISLISSPACLINIYIKKNWTND